MKQIILLKQLFGSDIFARSRSKVLRNIIDNGGDEIILDFDGVNFISRSFCDELFNLESDCQNKSLEYINRNATIVAMMQRVADGRQKERIRGIQHPKMYVFNDMESLSAFLSAQ